MFLFDSLLVQSAASPSLYAVSYPFPKQTSCASQLPQPWTPKISTQTLQEKSIVTAISPQNGGRGEGH